MSPPPRIPPRRGVRPLLLVLLLGWAPVLGGGCTALHAEIGHPIEPEDLPAPDATVHFRDVLAALGPPHRMSASDADLLFLYEYTSIKERQVGWNFDIEWLNLLKFSFGRGKADRQAALMIFDASGHLRAHQFSEWTDDLGGGNAVQFIVAVLSVVDTKELEEDPFQHRWGGQLLVPDLAVGLNRGSGMETGRAGVELIGTPDGAGQHTLESRQVMVEQDP